MKDEQMYDELAHRLRAQHETFKRWQRKIMNEPESEEKYAKFELMQKVIDRSAEVVNWWNNVEAKAARKEKHQQELARAAQKQRKRAKALAMIQETDAELEKSVPAPPAKSAEPECNRRCRHFCIINRERSCDIGMDMVFCSDRCAYATNMVGSTRVYKNPYSPMYYQH